MSGSAEPPWRAALRLLTDPDAFFARRAADPSLVGPAVVVFAVAGLGFLASLPVLRATATVVSAVAGPIGSIAIVLGLVGGVIGVLLTWLVYAGAFHVISAVAFGATGSWRTTLALTGWGFVPRIPEALLSAGLLATAFAGTTLPADPLALQAAVQQLQNDPLIRLSNGLGLVFLCWSGFLWTFAMRHGRELTLRQAAVTVAPPAAVVFAFDLLGILGLR